MKLIGAKPHELTFHLGTRETRLLRQLAALYVEMPARPRSLSKNTQLPEHETLLRQGPKRVSPFFIPASIVNLAAGQVSIRFGALGPNSAPCTACSTGSHAVGDAFRMIERGDADLMISGGSEAAITIDGILVRQDPPPPDSLLTLVERTDEVCTLSSPLHGRHAEGSVFDDAVSSLLYVPVLDTSESVVSSIITLDRSKREFSDGEIQLLEIEYIHLPRRADTHSFINILRADLWSSQSREQRWFIHIECLRLRRPGHFR